MPVNYDLLSPWGDMKRCLLLDNGTVNYYLDENDSTKKADGTTANLTGTDGQVMVEIPKFYYKTTYDGTSYSWKISTYPYVGYKLHPAFSRNGVTKNKIYMSAFEGYVDVNNKLCSIDNQKPTANKTIVQFRTHAQNRGAGWNQQDFLTVSAVQMLYLVEYSSFNSQLKISNGVTNITDDGSTNMAINIGYTKSLGNRTGQVAVTHYQTGQTTYAMSYRGIENFYGNIWKFVDGINIQNNVAWIADNNYQSDLFISPYVNTGLTMSTANGYVTNIVNSSTFDYTFLPKSIGGASFTKLCDYYWQSTGNRVALLGGYCAHGGYAGCFYWNCSDSSGTANRSLAARLCFVP